MDDPEEEHSLLMRGSVRGKTFDEVFRHKYHKSHKCRNIYKTQNIKLVTLETGDTPTQRAKPPSPPSDMGSAKCRDCFGRIC